MKTSNRRKFFAALLLSMAAGPAHSASCTPLSGCKVAVEDGTNSADFCSIFQTGAYLETGSELVYRYNGQTGVPCDQQYPDMAICQYLGGGAVLFGVGKYTKGNLACSVVSNTGGTLVFTMQYLNGEGGRSGTVTVHYQGGGEKFESFTLASELSFNLFLVAVVTYMVVGVLVMKYRKGAQGVELIPNYHFWKDFPFLVKDGVVFTFTAWPCCKHAGFTRNYTKL